MQRSTGKLDTPYISGIVDALVMSNPFAHLVISDVRHVDPESVSLETFQAVTRGMTEKGRLDEMMQRNADEKWENYDCVVTVDENEFDKDKIYEEILCADYLKTEQRNDASLRNVRELAKGSAPTSRNAQFYE